MFDVKFNLKSLPLPFTHITFLKRYPLKDVLPSNYRQASRLRR
jgi:hypothetical protein